MRRATYKTAKTIKPYIYRPDGYGGKEIVIPAGSKVSNQTACGPYDYYRFWVVDYDLIAKFTGCKSSMLAHDLTYRGLNIPADYCEPYQD